MIQAEMTLAEYAEILGIDDFDEQCEYDLSDVGTLIETPAGFKQMTNFVVKSQVDTHYVLDDLHGTSVHRTLTNGTWTQLKDNPAAICINESIKVVDISVPDGECYIANGHVNHNTTPGGELLASHAGV